MGRGELRPDSSLKVEIAGHPGELNSISSGLVWSRPYLYQLKLTVPTSSNTDTQDALGHRNAATTRVYVQRIAIKRDKHSRQITARLNTPGSRRSEP